ncbi:hypothetical protein ACFE04_015214 [Oxalis oulophora]
MDHKCKLCSRNFANGKALGGHMKAHMAILPLPPKTRDTQLNKSTESTESAVSLSYGLRENPKKSFKLGDPDQFSSFTAESIIDQHIEMSDHETESTQIHLTRKRSKRNWQKGLTKKSTSPKPRNSFEFDFFSDSEENVAMSLMMLSRDIRVIKKLIKCETCKRIFRSSQALGSHRRVCSSSSSSSSSTRFKQGNKRIHQCPFCDKVFGSGQALGGHKRSHLIASSMGSTTVTKDKCFIDLNLPAPLEDDDHEFSVVSYS